MPLPRYVPTDSIRMADDLAFEEQREEGIASLLWPHQRDAALSSIEALAQHPRYADPPPDMGDSRLPIMTTPAPPLRTAAGGYPMPRQDGLSGSPTGPLGAMGGQGFGQGDPGAGAGVVFGGASAPGVPSFMPPVAPEAVGSAAPPSSITSDAGPTVATSPAATAQAAPGPSGPTQPGEIEAYIRASARARGIDPDTAIRVVMAEGGLDDPVRQSDVVYRGRREQSYGPLQLNIEGGVGSAALKAGIDPRNPAQWRQAVDFGLDEVARSGWEQWHGAARVGIGPRQGIGVRPSRPPPAPATAPASAPPAAVVAAPSAAATRAPGRRVVLDTPNLGPTRQQTSGIVIHSTRGQGKTPEDEFQATLNWFRNPGSQVSASAVIGPDGTVAIVGDPDRQTWHAGSENAQNLGIELVQSAPDAAAGKPFTDAQYQSLAALTREWSQRYGFPITRATVRGHEETGQGRGAGKTDPGPTFDWGRYFRDVSGVAGQSRQPAQASPLGEDEEEVPWWQRPAQAVAGALQPIHDAAGAFAGWASDTAGQVGEAVSGGVQSASDAIAPYVPAWPSAPEPGPSQVDRYVPSYAPQAAQVTPEMAPIAAPAPEAMASPYDTDQPFRPTPRLGQAPAPLPVAADYGPIRDPNDTRAVDLGPHEAIAPPPRPPGYEISPFEGALNAIAPVVGAYDAVNEWAINNPILGAVNPQAWGRELAGTDQIYAETREDQQRYEALVRRFHAGDTSVEPEVLALQDSLNRRTRADRASLLAAGERNPDKTAETLGQIVQAGATTAIAPSLAAGPVRNVVGAALDPLGQGLGAGVELAGRGLGAARGALAPAPLPEGVLQLGSGVVPAGPNLEARIAAARAELTQAERKLAAPDRALEQAAEWGSGSDLRAAQRAYGVARRDYDDAAEALEALRAEQRTVSGRIEAAGFGERVPEGAALPGPSDVRSREVVPPFVDTAPRSGSLSLNAALGNVPPALRGERGAARTMTPDDIRGYEQAADAVASGRTLPPGAPVIDWQTTVTMPPKSQYHGTHPVTLQLYRTSDGRLIPLRPAEPGGMGTPLNAAYSKAVNLAGGRKGFLSGFWTDARGTQHEFDSPQEVFAMHDLDNQLAQRQITNWWRGDTNPRVDLQSIPWYSTNRDKGGLREYWPDVVVEQLDGRPAVVEIKPAKVIAQQEDYGVAAGQVSGKMGWSVVGKAMGILPYLAEQGATYRILTPRRTAAMIPPGAGTKADRMAGVPGLHPADRPQMRTKSISPEATSPGNEIVDIIEQTADDAIRLTDDLRSRGVPLDQRRQIVTRYVRDRLLPTAELRTKGGDTGQVRNMVVQGEARLGSWIGHRGPLTLDELDELDPDAVALLREAEQHGTRIQGIAIHDGPDGAATLHVAYDGDPQAAIRAQGQLGERNGLPSMFVYDDANGPVAARTVRVTPPAGAPPADFEQVRRMLEAHDGPTPLLIPRYTQGGLEVKVYGVDAAGTLLDEADLHTRLARVRSVLERHGAELDIGMAGRAEISQFAGEAGHAADRASAIERTEYQLGIRDLPRAGDAGDAGGAGGGASGARGRAADAADGAAGDQGRAPHRPGPEADDLDLDEDELEALVTLGGTPPRGLAPQLDRPDRLAAVNRVLSQGIASSVSGGVGAQVNQELNPDDPYAGLKGFAAGALVPPLAGRGALALARRAGATPTPSAGALATLGAGPTGPAAAGAAPTGAIAGLQAANTAVAGALEPIWRRVNLLRMAGMLSNTASQVANVGGSAVLAGRDLATAPLMLGQDVVRSAVTGRPRQVFAAEIPARLSGMATGLRQGISDAGAIMKTGLSPADASKLDAPEGFGTNIPGLAPKGSKRAAVVDAAAELPLRALGASDAIFRGMAQEGHLQAEATAAAMRANGGRAVTAAQVAAAAADPAVIAEAEQLARRSVLQEDRPLTAAARKFMQDSGLFGQVLALESPFVKTPYNVVAQGMEMSPAGLANVIKGTVDGSTAREQQRRLAEVMIGTAAIGTASTLYGAGKLTGPYPDDEKTRSTLPPGWRPWSFVVEAGGGTIYLPFENVAGPLAFPAVAAITAMEANKKKGTPYVSAEMAGKVAAGVGAYLADQTFFKGWTDLVSTVTDPERKAERHLEGLAAQFSPHVLGGGALGRQVQQILGMPARDPEGMWEALKATHPLTAGSVAPRQDVLGRPQAIGMSGPLAAVARAGVSNDAGVIRAFRRAGEGLPLDAPKTIKDPSTGTSRTLSPAQRHRWRRAFGSDLQQAWRDNGSPTDVETLRKLEAASRQAATDAVLAR